MDFLDLSLTFDEKRAAKWRAFRAKRGIRRNERMSEGSNSYGTAGLAAASLALAMLVYMATCSTADAAPVSVRYRHPGGDARAYDALEVCQATGCTRYPRPCASGATCELEPQLPPGSREVWLVARAGTVSSAASNRRTVTVPLPAGCEWDLNGDGVVTFGPSDFGPFLGRFSRGEVTAADFGRFMRASGTDCR